MLWFFLQHVEWSADSRMVLCVVDKEFLVQVFWVFEQHRNMRFSEASSITVACFTPDRKSLLVALCLGVSFISCHLLLI